MESIIAAELLHFCTSKVYGKTKDRSERKLNEKKGK
jgi:hypothetical protein